MNITLKSILCLFFFACSFTTISAKECIGSWTYTASDAPYGYYTGTVEFVQKDTNIFANVVIGDLKMSPIKVKKEDGNYTLDFYVDGSDVCVTFVRKTKDHYTGTAVFESSEIDVELKRNLSTVKKPSAKKKTK